MGLIDLKTDFKSLRYGKDTIGGGYSGQPYIQEKIPDGFNNLGANEDFILRGGANAIGDSITDIRRLTKMFFDLKSPNGLLFIAKQNLLSRTAVRTQTSGVVNEGVYTPLNTLAQAGVVSIGGHLNKQGLNPAEPTGAYANNDNLYSVKVKPTQDTNLNRLVTIYNDITQGTATNNFGFTQGTSINPDARIGGKSVPVLISYIGGPGSKIGIGNTNIRYSTYRTGEQNPLFVTSPNFFTGKNNQKSVDADNKQIGGLKIDPEKLWTKSPLYGLPAFNINSPQSSSFAQSNNGQYNYDSSLAKQDISGSLEGGKYDLYNPLRYAGISANESIYNTLLGIHEIESTLRDNDGNPLWYNSVYEPGTLTINNSVIGADTWTPPSNRTNPYGSNYRIGTDRSINYDVSTSTGVTKVLGLNQPEFLNPSVYQPSGSGDILRSNFQKTLQNGTYTYNNKSFKDQQPYTKTGKLVDFRKVLRESTRNPNTAKLYEEAGTIVPLTYINYNDKNIGVKNLIGNPGADRKNKNYSDFSRGVRNKDGSVYKALDLINASKVGDDLSNDDLIQFRIQSLFTGGSTLVFRAFLGGITDTYSAGINSQQYVGRGENFYTYSGQTRKISLSWTIAALSREELLPMYRRLNYLAGMTAPKYVDGFMQGPLINLTVGGYIYNLPGYIEGFSVDIAEDSTWDIAINPDGSKDNTISQLPHVVKVTGFNFTPIPNYLPEAGNADARFISIVAPNGTSL